MYGLPQVRPISYEHMMKHLSKLCYEPTNLIEVLCKYEYKITIFTPVVGDSGVKIFQQEDS